MPWFLNGRYAAVKEKKRERNSQVVLELDTVKWRCDTFCFYKNNFGKNNFGKNNFGKKEWRKRIFEVLKKQPDLQTDCNSLFKLTLGWVLGTTVLVPQVRRVALRFRCCQCLLWWELQVVIGGGCHFSKRKKKTSSKINFQK